MEKADYYTFDYWRDVIEELDSNADVYGKSQDFIISLMERKPKVLSLAQVQWLADLKRKHIA